jgi:type VI secretion system protein ImpH
VATTGRSENTALERWPIAELLDEEPYLFQFFQAVRLMSRMAPRKQVVGGFNNPANEVVRFGANPDVSFPASEVQSLEQRAGAPPLMRVNFMGLNGPQGVLPRTYSELVNDRIRARDHTVRDFLDLFNHRIISLFYQSWQKFHFEIPYERGERDRFSHYVLALLGLNTPGLQNRQDVADDSLLFYGGILSMHSRSATGLRQVLWDYFNVPVEIEQFVGAWYPVELESQCCLGENGGYSEQLGFGAVVGNETWDQQSRVRIQLGPLTLEQFEDFLPGREGHRQLRSLTRFYTGGEYDVEVQLILRRQDVLACELKARDDEGPQLGWTSWVKTVCGFGPGAKAERDADETVLEL